MTIPKISAKRLASLGGARAPFSTITKRGKPPKRGGKPKAKKRSAKEFARIFHSVERVTWISQRCCVACGIRGCENAHTAGEGMGRRGDYTNIIPLCPQCHRLQHQIGAGSFAIRFNINLALWARTTQAAWLASLPPLEASPKC